MKKADELKTPINNSIYWWKLYAVAWPACGLKVTADVELNLCVVFMS